MSFGEGLILSSSWWLGRSGESGMLGSSSERASGYRPSLGASRMRPLYGLVGAGFSSLSELLLYS
jgi:hypothetical protein